MRDYVNSAALQEYTTKLVAKLKTLFPGTPTAVATVAEMTDHNKTYVYVGTETGYTAGDWYYWDGSAWTSGGPFQATSIITDTTLAVAGEAADAKATGDAISAAKAAVLNAMAPAYSTSATYAVGDYVNYNGAIYRCTTAISTAEAWTAGHWAAVTLGADLEGQVSDLKTQINGLPNVVETEEDDADLYIADAQGYVIAEFSDGHIKTDNFDSRDMVSIDDTLTHSGEAADAKATGDAIGEAVDTGIIDAIEGQEGYSPVTRHEAIAKDDYIARALTEFEYSAMQGETLIMQFYSTANIASANLYLKYDGADGYTQNIPMKVGIKNEYVLPADVTSIEFTVAPVVENDVCGIKVQRKYFDYPDYYRDQLYTKVNRINELLNTCYANGDAFIFITDEHYEKNQLNSPTLVKKIADDCRITRVFSGGDTANSNHGRWYDLIRKYYKGKMYSVMGNHEWMDHNTNHHYYTADVYNEEQIGNTVEHYYYVDNRQKKIRYIILNAFDKDDTSIPGYNADQLAWFTGDALNVPEGYDIIVFTHLIGTTTTPAPAGQEYPVDATDFRNAMDAYNADNTHTGKIICIIQGHKHYDAVWHTTGGIPIITTTCDKNTAYNTVDTWLTERRIAGTVSEQAFDVMIIDRDNRTIKAVRIGALAMDNTDITTSDPNWSFDGTLEERTITY